ncbi:MAG: hypothetical protein HY710_07540 [Candidatus Latescibacteria bacterium]|nr:hypothetical protein [Candidatus Latescibacterota bacterium]
MDIKRQAYSFSFGYNHTNDLILLRHVLTNTGNVDGDLNGTFESTGTPMKNLFMVLNYDFDIPSTLDPLSNNIAENIGGDDKTPTGFFVDIVPRAVPVDLPGSGRWNKPPYGPRLYSGIASMFDEDDPGTSGVDDYIWSNARKNFNPIHMGEASLLVIQGNGTGALGDLDDPIQKTVWGGPSVGLFQGHQWWEGDVSGVVNWYLRAVSMYLKSYPGDPAFGVYPAQTVDFNPNPDFFASGSAFDPATTDISTWVPKAAVATLTAATGDPRMPGTFAGGTSASFTNAAGKYNNITLFDLDGPWKGVVPDPYTGSDRKEITSTTGCDRNMVGWGPFNLAVGQSLTIWQVDLVGAGTDGVYDTYLRAQDVWMQRKYNNANDTYYWDGSNVRTIPTYDGAGNITGTTDVNLGRGVDSGALFFPPPAPILSAFNTNNGTIALAWANNAETAIDPGTGATDFSKYRVYRAAGFIDQFPTATVAHPIGFNSTIIPPSMGLTGSATPITDVTDPTAASVKASHPYARFIQEGNVIGADYNIGRVFSFVTSEVNKFAAPSFAGPYVQIGEFAGGGGANSFNPPATVKVPNPIAAENRFPGFTADVIETVPSSRQVVDANTSLGATNAVAVTFPAAGGSYTSSPFASIAGIDVDPRIAGKTGYLFEDRAVLIGFNYWYYVAAVDNESAVQRDFDSFLQDPTGSSQSIISRQIDGLESFYTMNANGADGLWHGTFPFRGRTVGPEVPGEEVIPVTIVRNKVAGGVAEFINLVTVAPNPFVFQAQWDLATTGQQSVKFFNMPVPSRINIFDVAGLLVHQFSVPSKETQTLGGVTSWNLKNKSNVPVSGGLYIIVIEAEIGGKTYTKTLKLYIRR